MELLGRYSNPDKVARLQRILAGQRSERLPDRTSRSPRQVHHRLNADDVERLLELDAQGELINALATKFHISRTIVMKHLERAGARAAGTCSPVVSTKPDSCTTKGGHWPRSVRSSRSTPAPFGTPFEKQEYRCETPRAAKDECVMPRECFLARRSGMRAAGQPALCWST
jgi:hypothetical protein